MTALRKSKPKSRATRWTDAAGNCLSILDEMANHLDELDNAVEELRSVKEEYEAWKDNLPENLQQSPVGEKLEAICDLDLDSLTDNVRSAVEEAQGLADEANSLDLPMGFGRD